MERLDGLAPSIMEIAGGWLALGWPDDRHSIAVPGPTRADALAFYAVRAEWWREFHQELEAQTANDPMVAP